MPALEMSDLGFTGPGRQHAAVTPSDTEELTHVTRALWVGVAGDLAVTLAEGGNKEIYKNAQGWMILQVRQVWAAETTASGIVAVL